jgi:hypothetical protein
MPASHLVGGLVAVGQNEMCCNLCRLVGGIGALFILRSVGILSFIFALSFIVCTVVIALLVTYLYTLLYFTNITILGALGEVLLRIIFKHREQV